jgi:hypothetical protein
MKLCLEPRLGLSILAAVLVATAGCKGKEEPIVVPTDHPTPVSPPTNDDDSIVATTLSRAVELTRPKMVDGPAATPSDGAKLFAAWAQQNLAWEDIDLKPPETTMSRADADPATERGKRLCEAGTITELKSTDIRGAKVAIGFLARKDNEVIQFIAVRGMGSLAEKTATRFCGVMSARVDRTLPTGGSGHALQVIGMFDLPENKKPPPAAASAPRTGPGSAPKASASAASPTPTGRSVPSHL